MAFCFFSTVVSDLCLGKPALRSLPSSSTVADALVALKRSQENYLSVWNCNHTSNNNNKNHDCSCVGKICMVDILCFLTNEKNVSRISSALKSPVSVLLPKASRPIRHVYPSSSLLEVIDLVLDGAQNLVIPIKNNSRKKLQPKSSFGSTQHHGHEFCWLTQEDVVRFLLSSIGLFSPLPSLSIESLDIINDDNILSIHYDEQPSSDLISRALLQQTAIAVVDDERKLIGEISPSTLVNCDETLAAAITTLSAGDLMAYIDYGGPPPEYIIRIIKERLQERNLDEMVDLLDESLSPIFSSSSSSSDDENSPTLSSSRSGRLSRSGSYSAKIVRTVEAIVCYPRSSLIAVMIQAIAHRVTYIWVIEDDYSLAGIVTFTEILKVFREHFQSIDE